MVFWLFCHRKQSWNEPFWHSHGLFWLFRGWNKICMLWEFWPEVGTKHFMVLFWVNAANLTVLMDIWSGTLWAVLFETLSINVFHFMLTPIFKYLKGYCMCSPSSESTENKMMLLTYRKTDSGWLFGGGILKVTAFWQWNHLPNAEFFFMWSRPPSSWLQ